MLTQKWIESAGGPLVVVPAPRVAAWRGIFSEGPRTHYDEACGVIDEFGSIEVEHTQVLVLGDEPLAATWLPSATGGAIVRWVYGNSDASVLSTAEQAREVIATTVCDLLDVYWLFDAANAGVDVDEYLVLSFAVGTYRIDTLRAATRDDSVLVHRFRFVDRVSA